ncbi:MAG: prephenate dehydrogenase/arogenate dehydrogenase family protein [Oscillospiraceae bacterium]|nr:prephenate dehydrogenase/arogenate dehydrogenase family protein [Oscillospiraceae bacterium]
MFSKVGFIGLGLIGGSIAKAIKHFYPQTKICAIDKVVVQTDVVDNWHSDIDNEFCESDVIFLCAPVKINAQYLEKIKPFINSDTILTDVGSTKLDIHKAVEKADLCDNFIGGHPMAGSEKSGFDNSKRILIENVYYILTPTNTVDAQKVDKFKEFVTSLKALPVVMTPQHHDKVTAVVSHVPHLIASSLVNLVKDLDDSQHTMKQIAAGGFKDITRIASSSPTMWQQICMTNSQPILDAMQCYIQSLEKICDDIKKEQSESVEDMFSNSREYRNSIVDIAAGPIKKSFAFYCDMVDEAGGIATLATILASNNINIKNIGIVNNREFEEAVLKVELDDQDSYDRAVPLLRKYRYTVYER